MPTDSANPEINRPHTASQLTGGDNEDSDSRTPTSKPKIQIGSQRDAADVSLKPSQPNAVQAAKQQPVVMAEKKAEPPKDMEPITATVEPVEQKTERVEEVPAPVHSLEGLGDDLDSEIEAAIGGISMDAVLGRMTEAEDELEFNSRIKAVITKIHGDNVFVSLKGRFEGVLPMAQFKPQPVEGQLVEVVIKKRNEDDGLYEVSIPGSSAAVADWEDLTEGEIVEARVTGSNTGGLEVMVNNIRGFIPASQIARFRIENFGDFVNQKMQCLVTEVNPQKGKLVLSRRAILDRENDEKRKELLASIVVGGQHHGTITKLMDFGAFVDIGGIEGLVHISKLSWDRVTHPKEVVSEGERVTVKVERVNTDTGKISFSIRDTLDHPWENIGSKYAVNAIVKGTVTRTADFGAFVKLEPGIEGLVHISEIAHHRVMRVGNHLKQGDQVEVKIMSIDPEKQKIGLSIKETQAVPVIESKQKDETDEPLRNVAVPASDKPLRGGTDRKSGGEGVGLNW